MHIFSSAVIEYLPRLAAEGFIAIPDFRTLPLSRAFHANKIRYTFAMYSRVISNDCGEYAMKCP